MDDSAGEGTSVVRSEEQLRVSTRRVAAGRAVLRKRIVTEERTITVQVRHEEAHLEVVPFEEPQLIDEQSGGAHVALPEFVLYREEIAVVRTLVPVERVRLQVDRVVEQQTVTADLRKEQVTLSDSRPAARAAVDGPSSRA